jgi:hypothetical protein
MIIFKYKLKSNHETYLSLLDCFEALDNLTKMGFTYDYNIHEHEIENAPHIHEVKHVYRYEGPDPGDSAIVCG